MKAKRVEFLNVNDMDNTYYGIEVTDKVKKESYYALVGGVKFITKDKLIADKMVNAFNKKHNK